jgi:hypothetical protein
MYLVAGVFLWGLSEGIAQQVENHNSSRSNRGTITFPSGVDTVTIRKILVELDKPSSTFDDIDKTAGERIAIVSGLLKKYGVSGIKKIIVETGIGGLWRILLLREPGTEAAARAVAIQAEGVKRK